MEEKKLTREEIALSILQVLISGNTAPLTDHGFPNEFIELAFEMTDLFIKTRDKQA